MKHIIKLRKSPPSEKLESFDKEGETGDDQHHLTPLHFAGGKAQEEAEWDESNYIHNDLCQ